MTKRALLIAFIMTAMIAGVTYINNYVIKQADMIGNFMPICVYGVMVLSLITINPFLARVKKSAALKGREYAVIIAISMVACSVPGSGLMRFFPNAMMLPHHWIKTKMPWRNESALQMMPGFMIAGSPPELVADDVVKPQKLCADLVDGAKAGTLSPAQKRIWDAIPNDRRQAIAAAANVSQASAALTSGLNSILEQPDLYDARAFEGLALSGEARRILAHLGSANPTTDIAVHGAVKRLLTGPNAKKQHVKRFNRLLIDWTWPNEIKSRQSRLNAELASYMLGREGAHGPVALSEVPWSAWRRPLCFWLPLFLVMCVGVIAISLVVHKQWCRHESLPYPLIKFTTAMLPDEEGNGSSLFKKAGFWWGLGATFAIFMLNYTNSLFPDYLPSIPMRFDFGSLRSLFSPLDNPVAQWAVFTVRVFPLIIGLAYMVRSDVALSVALAAPARFIFVGAMGLWGITMWSKSAGGGLYSGSPPQLFIAGAFIAYMGQIIYTGRMYYMSVLRRMAFMDSEDEVERTIVWAARVFAFCAVMMSVYMMSVGVDWLLASMYTILAFSIFIVMSRVVAETGIFYYMANWHPCAALYGLFGLHAMGPQTMILMCITSTVLLVRPRESLMPFTIGALKLLDSEKVKGGAVAPWMVGAIVVALLIVVPVTLTYSHGMGGPTEDGWAMASSRYTFDKAVHMKKKLQAQGRLADVEAIHGLQRIAQMSPDPKTILFFVIGAVAVALLSIARMRWRWWPLHPVIVLLFFTQSAVSLWHSFLIGWLVRKVVVKYGGQRAYRRVMPVMMGMIAGNLLGLLIPNLIGALCYYIGGDMLPAVHMF